MTSQDLTRKVLSATPSAPSPLVRTVAIALMALGGIGLLLGFLSEGRAAAWIALLVTTAFVSGLGAFGALLSAIFQLTGARWGRAYRRIGEAAVVLMPVGAGGLLLLLLGGFDWLPWGHAHLHGEKALWLMRGFWDVRLLVALLGTYALSLAFLYYSLRRDFCIEEVAERFQGALARFVAKDIDDPESEVERCEQRLNLLAPPVAIVFAIGFSLIGFDLIMALEPYWFSTLFGAWFFIGHVFSGMALLVIVSLVLKARLPLGEFITAPRQRDLVTLLFAFCLVTVDFFWSQYLTIWYANLPEETVYIIPRTIDGSLPWPTLAWIALALFFFVPFVALLLRKVKDSTLLLAPVAASVVAGVFLARFIEVAPPLLPEGVGAGAVARALACSALVLLGGLGVGALLLNRFIASVPILPVGDAVFVGEFTRKDTHA